VVTGVWLTAAAPGDTIDGLLLELLEPQVPSPALRDVVLEELGQPVKQLAGALAFLGLDVVRREGARSRPLVVVRPWPGRDPWRSRLVAPGGDCPIGFVIETRDAGRVTVVHEVFDDLDAAAQDAVRALADHAAGGEAAAVPASAPLAAARRKVLALDPSVLFGPDGEVRVQVGSVSQTTRNILREGLAGAHVFVLPHTLFEGGTNFADVEFLVYLNFFARERRRVHIVGTSRQRLALQRLLTLTLFGVFDPAASEPAPFETLHAAYGVPDRAAYDFLRTAYETYAARDEAAPGRPVLDLDGYVDFAVLEDGEAVVRVEPPATTVAASVRVAARPRLFEVTITLDDGRSSAKTLEAATPRPHRRPVPPEARAAVQFATDRPRFGVTSLGSSHGFDPAGDLTCFVIWIDGKGILVDPSPEALGYLAELGVAPTDVPYVFLTHIHADHDSGLLAKLLGGSRTTIIASDPVFHGFIEKARVVTSHDFHREELVAHVSANPGPPLVLAVGGETAVFRTRWNLHPIPTNGFIVTVGDTSFGYSGDTQYDPALVASLVRPGGLTPAQRDDLLHFFWTPGGTPTVALLFHEAGIPPIHTDKQALAGLPPAVVDRTQIVHIADADVPRGFRPAKPALFATRVLLPGTAATRARALLDALRRVAYFHDLPEATLTWLLQDAVVRVAAPEEVLLRRGPVETPHFYAVTDGEVAVRDGRRLLARLVKGDTFGEWGVNLQRGYRVADVAATRAAQCLQFTEAQYAELVRRHPVVQERISRMEVLLPRLKRARDHARLRAQSGRAERPSVLETMTEGQLASLAQFGEIRTCAAAEVVVREGDAPDALYVLLSGRLAATVAGTPTGDLGEGEVFGEVGLLEGGRRGATLTAVSSEVEILVLSRAAFDGLVRALPAFAWGLRETAAGRFRGRPDSIGGSGRPPSPPTLGDAPAEPGRPSTP
jgi:CRP-like cAMP-binding protein